LTAALPAPGAKGWPALVVAGLLAGCAVFQPRPIEPAKVEAEFRGRSLQDPGLRAYLDRTRAAGRPAPGTLDLAELTLVAFYFHPDLDVARARVAVAEAGVLTAGGRPNPRVSLVPEYNADALAGVSPWILAFSLEIPVETAGKRGYRIAHAERLTEAARLELAEAAWRVRSGVRATLLEHLFARREVELRQAEERIRAESVLVMEKRIAVGDVSRPDVDTARAELASTRLARRAAAGRVTETRAALAAAVGLPVSALEDVAVVGPDLDRVPLPEAPAPGEIQRAGLVNRADVRRALAEYAAAESLLRLEIARQYPDVHVGPGYTFDQGDDKFSIGLAVTLPVLNRNEGPIAEAEARRRERAARFLAIQSGAIGEIERALGRYRAAVAETTEADAALRLLEARERATARALELGEADRLALVGVSLQRALAAGGRLEALRKVQAALGALEDAVQRPLLDGGATPELPAGSPR
jgi:outer membrane protein TolC